MALAGWIMTVMVALFLIGASVTPKFMRAEMPLYSHTLFSIYVGIFLWIALWLRDPALRNYFGFSRT